MATADWLFQSFGKFYKMVGKQAMRGIRAVSRCFSVWAAGGILAAGLWMALLSIDVSGGTLLAYGADKSPFMLLSGRTAGGPGKYIKVLPREDILREGRLLVGKALAQDVSALKKARRLRQGYIEQARRLLRQQEEAREAAAGHGAASIGYSGKDYEVLQRIVEAEAGGCDVKGRILVANVIINRVKSREFPDTVTGVVYQKSQFSPVQNGTLDSCTVSEETREAVDRALAGEDYSQGALYFMNRRWSDAGNAAWFDQSLTYLFRHGGHEFFR